LRIRTLKKQDFKVIVVWLGSRRWDYLDLNAFRGTGLEMEHYFLLCQLPFTEDREFDFIYPQNSISSLNYLKTLWRSHETIQRLISDATPVAIFTIMSWNEIDFIEKTDGGAQIITFPAHYDFLNSPFFFDYKIIMDGSRYSIEFKKHSPNRIAMDLGALWSFYNNDAPSSGAERLADLINRIMGYDLPGEEFPNYSPEELRKISKHISRENFNSGLARKESIPKYKIGENGRPIFPDVIPGD
jgi:hypothetical protein